MNEYIGNIGKAAWFHMKFISIGIWRDGDNYVDLEFIIEDGRKIYMQVSSELSIAIEPKKFIDQCFVIKATPTVNVGVPKNPLYTRMDYEVGTTWTKVT